ncbi:MAG: cation diffusion facilitator family transporter [Thermoplasmata archaeon]|nr:cation diffusion facilitator family transporter [Thermoplasmata archaeon]
MRPLVIVWATVILDAGLFVVNLFVALISGSHAVLSQAVYNAADLVGGVMLVWGYTVSQKAPTYDHPFGYGKERFFWSFAATLTTFTASGLAVFADGFLQIVSPQPVGHLGAALAVVGATLAVSFAGIYVTLRELRQSRETLTDLLESSQQGLKAIFYQDIVSVLGSVVAFFGIVVVYRTQDFAADGITACGVAILLIATGFVLAAESRELLVGKAVSPEQARAVLALIERHPRVRRVRGLQSMMLGPDDALLALRVNFQDGLTTDQIETVIDQVSSTVREEFPSVRHLIIEPES